MENLVMCIGNRDGGDDAIGPYIADILQNEKDLIALDCGTVPENYTSIVKQFMPETVIIVDAIEMGLSTGEIRIVSKEKIGKMHISTHGIPISILIQYLEDFVDNILLIGIQPENMSGEITETVKQSGDKLAIIVKNLSFEQIETLI